MHTATESESTVFLLLRAKDGRKRKTRTKVPVRKGELVEELNEVIPADQFSGEHTYRVYNEPSITFYCDATDVAPLVEAQPNYLMAVSHDLRIREFFNTPKKEYVMGLKMGDEISFRVSTHSKPVRGRIRHLGPVEKKKGAYFGVEIDENDEYRGKGTTAGYPYFNCAHKNAVWVSMDMVVYTSSSSRRAPCDQSSLDQPSACAGSNHSPVAGRRASHDDSRSSRQSGASNVASKVKKFMVDKHKVLEDKHHRSKLYKEGDRVVIYSMKDQRPITATVRWTGLVEMSKRSGLPSMIIAGLELDSMIVPEKEFPDICIDLVGLQWAQFIVKRGHTKLYVPEEILLSEADYKKQQKEQQQIAKELEVSVSHLTTGDLEGIDRKGQQKIMDEAKAQRIGQDDPIQSNEECLTAGQTPDYADLGMSPEELKQQEELMKQYEQVKDNEMQARLKAGNNQVSYGTKLQPHYPGQPQRVHSYQRQNSGSSRHEIDRDRQHYRDEVLSQHDHQKSSPNLAVKPPYPGNQDTSASPHSSHHQHAQNRPVDHHKSNHPVPAPHRSAAVEKKNQEEEMPSWLVMGNVVAVRNTTLPKPVTGTMRFIGHVKGFDGLVAGLELDEIIEGCSNGGFRNKRYFYCPDGRGYFCRICDLQSLDSLHSTPSATSGATVPVSTGGGGASYTNPLNKYPQYEDDDGPGLFSQYIGNERGIQGHHNSCYLDSTVFGLFALSDAFDEMFLSGEEQSLPVSIQEKEYCKKTKQILWKGIVNPLRKHGVARFESVMELRDCLEQLGAMEGANRDEKDPEEFLNMLFKKVLHVPPFISIKRPSGVEGEYFVQLFFELDPKQDITPFTDYLLCKMFEEQKISLTKIPSKLLLQMQRFGKDFKMYKKVFPSLVLDVSSIVDSSKQCWFCGSPATVSCPQCTETVFRVDNSDREVALCDGCLKISHRSRKDHSPVGLHMYSKMKLLSVICIETSHYVCFTRCEDRWLFHDSMADRVYDMYNIPCVTEVTKELNEWVYSGNVDRLMTSKSYEIPECVRRFTQDGYMCVYVNPDLEMYGDDNGGYCEVPVSHTVAPSPLSTTTTTVDSRLQKLKQENENLIQQSESQQDEIKRLTKESVMLQQDKKNMEATLSEQLKFEKQVSSQTQEELLLMTNEKRDTLSRLQQKTQESKRLQEEKTSIQQDKARLQSEKDSEIAQLQREKDSEIAQLQRQVSQLQSRVQQLQSRIEQQPELGSDSDISFWLVSHTEVHSTDQKLGKGGWGSVVVGSFRGQSVAVKELHSTIRSPVFDKLLRREISLMAKIRHPNLLLFIAAVLDKPGRSDPIIITELLDTDLRSAYHDGKLASNRVRLFILRDVAAALNYLHLQREPIIHRDVSSANVLLQALPDNKWRGKLSDFGSANIVQYASTPGPGNRQYTAPEVLREEKQSTKMDVYSYGKLLCEVFTNQFPDSIAFPSMMQSMARSWPLMHRIVSTCVDHDPTKRPTMNSIVEQLNRLAK